VAETLGSIIDKLIIKRIRLHHLEKMAPTAKIKPAIRLVNQQIEDYTSEIEDFLKKAVKGEVIIKEPKIKLYKNPPSALNLKKINKLGKLIDLLSKINTRQWDLEDQIREKGIAFKKIAGLKREIDLSNKDRNDSIDRIDEVLEKQINSHTKTSPAAARNKELSNRSKLRGIFGVGIKQCQK